MSRIGEDYRKARSNPQEAGRLDRLSTSEYMTRIGMEGWIRDCMEVLFKMEMGLECEEQSALTFISQLAPDREGKTMLFDLHDERYLVKGGAQRLPDALAARRTDPCASGLGSCPSRRQRLCVEFFEQQGCVNGSEGRHRSADSTLFGIAPYGAAGRAATAEKNRSSRNSVMVPTQKSLLDSIPNYGVNRGITVMS